MESRINHTNGWLQCLMPIVDSWILVDNHSNPREIIADYGEYGKIIHNVELFNSLLEYVNKRTK